MPRVCLAAIFCCMCIAGAGACSICSCCADGNCTCSCICSSRWQPNRLEACVRLYAAPAAVGVFPPPKSVPAHCMHTCLCAGTACLKMQHATCRLLLAPGPGLVSTGSSSFTGLPPRCSNSPLEGSAGGSGSAAQHGTPHQQYGWRPHRLSGTDIGSGGSSGWCVGSAPLRETPSPRPGPAPAHVGFANGHAGCAPGSAGSHSTHHTLSGHVTPSALLGSSPGSSSNPGSCAGPSASSLLGTSPHVMSHGSWGAAGDGTHPSRASSSAGGVLGPNGACGARVLGGPECSSSALNYSSASPGGSCSSSWAGTSPLAAALAAGASSLPHPRAGVSGGAGWSLGGSSLPAGGLAAAMAAVGAGGSAVAGMPMELQQHLLEPEELADYSQLPEKCWMDVLQRLGTRELCCAARVNT